MMVIRATCIACFAIGALASSPSGAAAQFEFVRELFRNVTDLRLVVTRSDYRPRWTSPPYVETRGGGSTGLGLELLFGAGSIYGAAPEQPPPEPTDTTAPQEEPQGPELVYLELAVGYTDANFDAFTSEWEIRGSLRQLPAITLYGSFVGTGKAAFYIGLRSGLVQLSGTRAFMSTGEVFAAGAQSIQIGALGGVVAGIWKANIFVEGEVARRRFASLEWTKVIAAPDKLLPASFPRDFHFSNYSVSIGVQLQFKDIM